MNVWFVKFGQRTLTRLRDHVTFNLTQFHTHAYASTLTHAYTLTQQNTKTALTLTITIARVLY